MTQHIHDTAYLVVLYHCHIYDKASLTRGLKDDPPSLHLTTFVNQDMTYLSITCFKTNDVLSSLKSFSCLENH